MSNFPSHVYDTWNKISPDSGRWYKCLQCGANHADCLHHILGRGFRRTAKANGQNSILNSAPLNNELCHIGDHAEVKGNYCLLGHTFKIIRRAVDRNEYSYRPEDYRFYEAHKEIYKELNCNLPDYAAKRT